MKYILCQPAIKRFDWELRVFTNNALSLGIKPQDIVLLFVGENEISHNFEVKGFDVHCYSDRENTSYIPSIKPYLWWKYLEEDSNREQETYVYIDSDVIFRKKLDFRRIPVKDDIWYCSDCNGYLNLDYIRSCDNGDKVLKDMADIVGVTIESLETINNNSGGAQWVIKHPTPEYWKKVYEDSNKLWKYFKKTDSSIQKWTAEMWSQLWNMIYFNIEPVISDELSFSWSTDPVKEWDRHKILHNAGVTSNMQDLFFKGSYSNAFPSIDDLNNISSRKCSSIYVKYVKEALYD